MALLGKRLAIAFPDTILEEKDTLRDKTAKLGLVARASAIYGVDVIEAFTDEKGRGELPLIREVLEFLETPQYLRKRLYPLDDALRFAGILPPLRIPSHKPRVRVDAVQVGEFREGVTNRDGTVEVGLDQAPRLVGSAGPDKRVTIRIKSKNPFSAELARREDVREYWGYSVEAKSGREIFSDRRFDLKVSTSRLGRPITTLFEDLRASLGRAKGVKLVFGSPTRGLFDIFGEELEEASDYVVNLFPEQHVGTVRTEEAIFAGLGLLNLLSSQKA